MDVALATAAAPTYFPAHVADDPIGRGKWVFWDGGIVANNPGLAALGEVLRLDLASRGTEVREHQGESPDVRVLSLGTGYRNLGIAPGDWGWGQAAGPVVGVLLDASVGSTAFLLRQLLGKRGVRVNIPLTEDYALDDPDAVDRLNEAATGFANTSLGAVRQPDNTTVDLRAWLSQYWFQ